MTDIPSCDTRPDPYESLHRFENLGMVLPRHLIDETVQGIFKEFAEFGQPAERHVGFELWKRIYRAQDRARLAYAEDQLEQMAKAPSNKWTDDQLLVLVKKLKADFVAAGVQLTAQGQLPERYDAKLNSALEHLCRMPCVLNCL